MTIRTLAPLATLGLAVITCVTAQVSELWGTCGELWSPTSRLPDFSFAGYRSGEASIPTPAATASVMDFGAVGDGIADDTTAFENAIAATTDGAITIPAGRYKITRVLHIRKSNLVLRGAGQGLTTLVFPKHLTELLGPPPGTAGLESWSWGGGLIWVEGAETTTILTDVTTDTTRGSKVLTVSSTAGLAVGQTIRLTMSDPDGSLGRHIHADQLNAHPTLVGRRLVRFPSKIAAISGNEITLERPLRHDVKTRWSPEIRSFSGQLEEVGLEGFKIEFPTRQYKGHYNEDGFNGIWMDGVANSWVRNVTVHNFECGIMIERSIFSTVDNVSLTADVANRLNVSGTYFTGHHGIQLRRSDDCMVSNFDIPTRTYHDLTVEDTTGCVYMKGSGVDLNFDHHTYLPHENLFTEINIGTGTRHFASSGSRYPESAARETIWNMSSTNPVTTLPNPSPTRGLWPQPNFIGFNTTLTTSKEPVLPWIEAITTASLTPANLYEAQFTRRLTPPAVVPLTLTWDGSGVGTAGAQGGSGTWNTNNTSNWWNGAENEVWPVSGGTDDNAVFAGTAGTVTVATAGVTTNDITVSTPGYVFSGGPIILNGESPTFTISGGSTCNIESILAGASGLSKSGPSTLQLRAANRYQGDTRVLQGILLIGLSNNRLPITTRLILGDGADSGVFQMNSRSQQVGGLLTTGTGTTNRVINSNSVTSTFTVSIANDADTNLFNGNLGGTGNNDNNYNFVKSGLGRLILAGDCTYTGTTSINSGITGLANGATVNTWNDSSANARNGSTRLMGTPVNGTTTSLGTGYRIVSVVTTGNVEASRLSRDRTQTGRSWNGDVAEIIIYNRALTENEEARIGNYLAQKYALPVSFPGVAPDYTTDGSTWSNGYLGVFHLRETSGQHLSSTPGAAPTRSVSATNQGTSTGIGTLAIGTCSHVAYTVAGSADHALALYQDGALVGTARGQSNNVLTGLNIAREFSTRYLNATVDEVRISNVARSAAWLQATHATISAPSTFASASAVSTYTANAPAMVATLPATAIAQTTATLNGSLLHTGGLTTSVTLHYGTTDGGTTPANWDHSLSLGNLPIGNFSTDLNTLTSATTYHYRVFASNSNGSVWAPDSVSFTTRPGTPTGLTIAAIEGNVSLQWNSATANTLTIAAGNSLTIAGNVSAGTYNSATTSSASLTATGAGTLNVSDESGQFTVGSSNSGNGVTTTVNLSALQNFNLQYPSDGGVLTLGNGSSINTKAATLTLAANNLIELDAIQIGSNQVSNATQTLRLGSGTNILHVDSISIGTTTSPSGGGRGIGALLFNTSTGTLNLRDPSGTTGSNLFIADNGGNGFGSFDVTGHHADIMLNSLRMGASSNATSRTDTFSFDQGILDIVSLDVGLDQNTTFTRTSQINLGGGTVTLGTGPKILFMQGTDRRLQLSNSITLPGNLTINASSNSFDGGGIENLDGDNTIASSINFTTGNAPLNISSSSGNITPTATGRSLFLGGTSESENTISGQISDGNTTNLPLTKQGSGTWTLSNTQTYTGPTTINAGKLILSDASLASPISVTTGTLAPQGTPTTSGSVSINSTGRLQASPGDTLTVGGSITLAGHLDLIAPPGLPPGTSHTILHKTSAGPVSGTFAGLPEGSSFNSSGYDWQITYLGGDGNDVVVSIATPPNPHRHRMLAPAPLRHHRKHRQRRRQRRSQPRRRKQPARIRHRPESPRQHPRQHPPRRNSRRPHFHLQPQQGRLRRRLPLQRRTQRHPRPRIMDLRRPRHRHHRRPLTNRPRHPHWKSAPAQLPPPTCRQPGSPMKRRIHAPRLFLCQNPGMITN